MIPPDPTWISVFWFNEFQHKFYLHVFLNTKEYIPACDTLWPVILSNTQMRTHFLLTKYDTPGNFDSVYWSKRDWWEWRRRESSKHIRRKERKYSLYKKERSRQIAVRAAARRQTGDGWMDVGFFDVNARGNTSSIMATTAVVNFYILRATSPIPRNLILQHFSTHQLGAVRK